MSCVNTNMPAYKALVKGMTPRQELVARALISKYMTENNDKLPSFVELKSLTSDLYNSSQAGIDYQAFYGEVKSMFKTLIPSMSEAELDNRVKFVDRLELMRLRGGKEVLTSFINGVVYVSNSLVEERGEQAYTDIRHEIFHVVFNNFLNEKEQITMVETFKRWKPEFAEITDKVELEEAMADAFEDYKSNQKKSIPTLIKEFFKEILQFFGLIGNHYTSIQRLFEDVNNGKFTRNQIKDSLVTRDKTIITKHNEFFTNPDLFLQAKAFVLRNLNELMFPSENKKLSEVTNNNLFINQSVPSTLFQNNIALFKLGLTKDEALKQIQQRIQTIKDTKDLDPNISKVIEVLSSKRWSVLKDMFNYLQPYSQARVNENGELELKDQVGSDPTEALLESDEELNNLEIGSKELINPTTKISEVVKDFLSSVTYPISNGEVANIDPGAGFIALLNLLGNLYGNTSVEDNLNTLKANYNNTAKGNQTKAVYNRLLALHQNVEAKNVMTLNIKGVNQTDIKQLTDKLSEFGIRHEIFKNDMTIVLPDNMRIENQGTNNVDNEVVFTLNRVKEGKDSFLIRQNMGETNKAFVERIASETGIPNFIVNKLFIYNEERNQLAELTKVAGSLRKLNPKFVRISTTRVNAQEGVPSTVTSYHFIDRVNELRDSISTAAVLRERMDIIDLRKELISLMDRYRSLKDKVDANTTVAFRNLLHEALVLKLSLVSEADFTKISDNRDVAQLLNGLERVVNPTLVKDITSDKPAEEFSDTEVYLRQTSNFANLLNKYVNEKNNPTSFKTSTSNKQKWENVMPNTSIKIFKNLQEFALNNIRVDKLLPYLRNGINNYLRFNPIFQHDLKTGKVSVNENMLKFKDGDFYADHQETYFDNKTSTYVKPPIPFSKESPRDWINRNFLAMFQIPIMEAPASRTANLPYFQQKFQPESAPNVSMVKMGVNSADQIENNIMNMFLQEAYMQHIYSTSPRKGLRKNVSKSYLPGLEGRSYFMGKDGNLFFDAQGNLNSQFGIIIDGKIQINRGNPLLRELYGEVIKNLDASMEKFVDMAINEKATLNGIQIDEVASKISNSYLDKYKLTSEDKKILRGINISAKTDLEVLKSSDQFQAQRAVLKKAMSSYYLNSFVNGFFMNQLSSGATQNYKNPLDEVKRQAGVNAMNDTGLIDNKHGIKQSYKNVVIKGANNFYGASHEYAKYPLLKRFFRNKKQEVGDAQSWDIPEFKHMLRKSFGKSVDIGVVTKDVHFEINEQGGVDYRKTSSAELTNELVQKNKTLRDLRYAMTFGGLNAATNEWYGYLGSVPEAERATVKARIDYLYNKMIDNADRRNRFNGLRNDINEYMEYQNLIEDIMEGDFMIHKASFDSAIKGSKPGNLSEFVKDQETGTFNFQFHNDSVLSLNSAYTGIQQAIRHKYIDAAISHFTQLTYLIGLNRTDTSIKNNKTITRALSKFTKAGIFDSLFDYRMAYDNQDGLLRVNNRSKKEVIKDLKKKLDLPGNETIMSLLDTPGISFNNPIFSEKLMQTLFNTLTKKTVSPKHPGGSFVLQSEFGFEANKILQENSLRTPEFRPDLGYAECYLPEMYKNQIEAGDMIYYNSDHYNKMFGFRIPSSDLHSSVPLKVIGYYPSSSHDNVVVIPAAVTALHGSDFDVDKLFVVRHGVFGMLDNENDPKTDLDTEDTEAIGNGTEYKTKFQSSNITIGQKGIKFGYTAPNAVYNEKNQIKDFGDAHVEINNLDDILLDEKEKTMAEIIRIEVGIQDRESTPAGNLAETMKRRRARTQDENSIKELREHLKVLRNIQKGLYSNQVLDAVLDNIDYRGENAEDIFTGISFDPVKGYEEESEYSQLARVYSDINKAAGSTDLLAERPTLFTSVDEARSSDPKMVADIESELKDALGVDLSTPEGQEDLLSLINDELKDEWVSQRDAFIGRVRGSGTININKVEDHVTMHKETYMAAGLVGLIANFSKGLAYAFHGITGTNKSIELDLNEDELISIDGQTFGTLSLVNKEDVKTQELRSLALNAAIDHVKEQILNVLNVGNKTAKIFLAAISTEMSMHQATMVLLQPVAKELNSSNAGKVVPTLKAMALQIQERLQKANQPLNDAEVKEFKVTTAAMEKLVTTDFNQLIANTDSPTYRQDLLLQYKVIQQLGTLELIGQEVSNVSSVLSIIQGLPYSLEVAYEKLKAMDDFISIEKFFAKLAYTEKSEYANDAFKADLRSNKNILKNVNLAYNENVLAALEAIKVQIDMVSELFTENSLQAQHLVNGMIKAISKNSDPTTMFTGESDIQITPETTKNMTISEKYLKGKNSFNLFKIISRNIFNFLSSGLNIKYNSAGHLYSLTIQGQDLATIEGRDGQQYQLNAVRSYVNSFLMKEGDALETVTEKSGGKNVRVTHYKGEDYIKSQINPEWRLKPLSVIKKENRDNKFLRGLGIDMNFKEKIRVMTFNTNMVNNAENFAEVEKAVHELNGFTNIYVKLNEATGKWEDVPMAEHPVTDEMSEITFNILKASLYIDKFKFGTTRVTGIIPPSYYVNIFREHDTLVKDLIYFQKNEAGVKYFKDFTDLTNKSKNTSVIGDIKENLFINTIFSIPNVLPNLKSILPSSKDRRHRIRQAGILPNGNIYDLYFDSKILDNATQEKEEEQAETTPQMIDAANTLPNSEVSEDISEQEAEADLYETLRKNPSFIVEESFDRPGNYEIYMKVGTTGSKETKDQKYYYKKIGFVGGKLTNNSFNTNQLLNKYKIGDHFNPKRLAIPVRDTDINQNRITLTNVPIGSFLVNATDNERTINDQNPAVKEAFEQQFQILRAMPENRQKSDDTIKSEIRTKVNVENVINRVNEVSLYDSRNLDRTGLKNFKVVSRSVSADRRHANFTLEALHPREQISYNSFESPLVLAETLSQGLTKEQKIAKINATPGAKPVTSGQELTDAEIDLEYKRALELDESRQVNEVLKTKNC